jgi:hypothetical protein
MLFFILFFLLYFEKNYQLQLNKLLDLFTIYIQYQLLIFIIEQKKARSNETLMLTHIYTLI